MINISVLAPLEEEAAFELSEKTFFLYRYNYLEGLWLTICNSLYSASQGNITSTHPSGFEKTANSICSLIKKKKKKYNFYHKLPYIHKITIILAYKAHFFY